MKEETGSKWSFHAVIAKYRPAYNNAAFPSPVYSLDRLRNANVSSWTGIFRHTTTTIYVYFFATHDVSFKSQQHATYKHKTHRHTLRVCALAERDEEKGGTDKSRRKKKNKTSH